MCVHIQKNMYHAHHQIFFKSLMASQGLISNILLTNIFVIKLLSGKAHFKTCNLKITWSSFFHNLSNLAP